MKIAFIADFFSNQIVGGAENNDSVLFNYLSKIYEVQKINSKNATIESLKQYDFFIVSNFVFLPQNCKDFIETQEYIIYEHDHKYVSTRDPSVFVDFEIPSSKIVNKDFYINAKFVVVLSEICKEVIEKNLNLKNVVNIGTSLWSDQQLDILSKNINNSKQESLCVLKSNNKVKNQDKAEFWCNKNNKQYSLVGSNNYEEFIKQLSSHKGLVFIPSVLETFSRLSCEAKILGLDLITNKRLLGFASETSFSMRGEELLEETKKRTSAALKKFEECIEVKTKKENIINLNFITYDELVQDTLKLVKSIPKDKYDAIAPVMRSGAIPAFIISERLNLPMLIDDKIIGGNRVNTRKEIKNLLLVDDSVSSGRAMVEQIKKYEKYNLDCLAVYILQQYKFINYYSRVVKNPRMFEWNMFNNLNLKNVMFDMDGVICIDPRVYDDDGIKYQNEITSLPKLFVPRQKIHSICTNRIERWRSITEEWLQKHNVRYGKLIMQQFSTAVERRKKSNAGEYKAFHYKNSNASLFVESSKWQAETIFRLTNKPVYCIENFTFYGGKK